MSRHPSQQGQQGIVLMIALIMLVVISMLATLSIRNATSSESVAGNVRTTALASQAAEIALRYCEDVLVSTKPPTSAAAPAGWNELPYEAPPTEPKWKDPTNWDKVTAEVFVVPATSVNAASVTFKRPPECMVQQVQVVAGTPLKLLTSTTYVITARGFGPEVAAADGTRSRPLGSEVWLQSTIEVN